MILAAFVQPARANPKARLYGRFHLRQPRRRRAADPDRTTPSFLKNVEEEFIARWRGEAGAINSPSSGVDFLYI